MSEAVREVNGNLVVSLTGEIDLDRAPEARRLLLDCVKRSKDVLVDLSAVTYIDSSGIASLVEALQWAKQRGTGLCLVAVSPQALRVFELARLDTVFAIHPDLATALAGEA
ncbi:STAS domain-containing protein [Pelagibius sp. CAU 1746]|uniref:STAS domain-containing protein n=1 Tax=Pelagibius sp. CAU 1746 TaxID=3140370 RepID=UPI00325AD7ED